MTLDPELRQMLRDAGMARAHRSWIVQAWHALAERADIASASFRHRPSQPKGPFMLIDDVRHALRRLRSRPGTAVTAAAMLALAIGVTAAMFTVADHMLFTPAPFKNADQIKWAWLGKEVRTSRPNVPVAMAKALRSVPGLSAVNFVQQDSVFIEGNLGLVNKGHYWVSPGTFEMLGAKPILGRVFVEGEGRPGNDDIAVISERVWRDDLSADPAVIGKPLMIGGRPVTVIGVMAEGFRFPSNNTEIWRPYDIDAPTTQLQASGMYVYVRIAKGAPDADVSRVMADATLALSKSPSTHGFVLRAVGSMNLDAYSKTAIKVLMSGVGLVFLVLCANVANLVLARTSARRQEFGVCTALGASRARLVRQVFTENAVIGIVALAAGLALAQGLVTLAQSFMPEDFLWRTLNPIAIDTRAILATAGLGFLATLLAGLPPAWIGTKQDAADSIRLESRGASESRGSRGWTRLLLTSEVAFATALLIGAGVLTLSFVRLMTLEPGLNLKNVTTLWVTLPEFYFKDRPARAAFAEELQRQVRALPRVQSVTLSFGLPPDGGGFSSGRMIADGVPSAAGEQMVFSSHVTAGFFDVYGIKILEGRTFDSADDAGAAIVSRKLADTLWPGVSPIGRTFTFEGWKESMHVVGLASEVRSSLSDPREDLPEYYTRLASPGSSQVMLGLRCDGSCPVEPILRERVRAASPWALLYEHHTLEDAYAAQFSKPRAAAWLAVSFGVVAMLAAAGGLFSLLTYAVSRRRREFGVRAALGAEPAQLRRMVMRDGLSMAGVGLFAGAGLAVLLGKTLESLSFGVATTDPNVWGVVAGVILLSALAATWRPARQAMRADPITLLRDN